MVLRDPVGLSYAITAVVFVGIAHAALRRRAHNPTLATSLAVVMLALAVAAMADAVAVSSIGETTAAVASLAILPAVSIAAGAFGCLALTLTFPQWTPPAWLIAVLLIEPVAVAAAAATNPWHGWLYSGSGFAELTGSAAWLHAPGYWAHTGYCYLAFGGGAAVIAWGWWTASPAFRRQRLTFFLATAIPVVGNSLYVLGGFNEAVDPTPFCLAVTGVLMAHTLVKQDLITFSPVARALIVDQIGDAVMVVNPAGRIVDLNAAGVRLAHALRRDAPEDLIGLSCDELFGRLGGVDEAPFGLAARLPEGPAEFQVCVSPLLDARGGVLGEVFVARDVTEANALARSLTTANTRLVRQVETIEHLRADLAELSSRDALTGLHNRRYMVERFGQMVAAAEASGATLAVVLLDIDRFKAINDVHGHLGGDEALVVLAQRIRVHAPTGALVARWGGEEFFVALPGADAATGLAFADDVRAACERDGIPVAGRVIPCTVSGGVALYPGSGTTVNELFHAADVALFEAKNAGRNRVRLYARFTGPATESLLAGPRPHPGSA